MWEEQAAAGTSRRLLVPVLMLLFGMVAAQIAPIDEVEAQRESERNTIEVVDASRASVVSVEVLGAPDARGGSGFVVGPVDAPLVATAYHVVQSAVTPSGEPRLGTSLVVRLPGYLQPVVVQALTVDAGADLALLEPIDSLGLVGVPPLELADSDGLRIGQKAIAIGNPFGLEATVTSGIVSGTSRFIALESLANVPLIQTDAALNPGSSGGAAARLAGAGHRHQRRHLQPAGSGLRRLGVRGAEQPFERPTAASGTAPGGGHGGGPTELFRHFAAGREAVASQPAGALRAA